MSKLDEQSTTDTVSEDNARYLRELLEIERVANLAVKEAQEENRRLGIPNYYEVNGHIVSDRG